MERPSFTNIVSGFKQIRKDGPSEWSEGRLVHREYVSKLPDRGAYREAERDRAGMIAGRGSVRGGQMARRAKSNITGAGVIVEVNHQHLKLAQPQLEERGRFGPIYKGRLTIPGQKECQNRLVAAKCFGSDMPHFDDLKQLIRQCKIDDSSLKHDNVIELIGIQANPVRMIYEFVGGGSLLSHLQNLSRGECLAANKSQKKTTRGLRAANKAAETKQAVALARGYVSQIAAGMAFLAEHGVVHGRLCADNVLMTEGRTRTVKISNFGDSGYNLAEKENENRMENQEAVYEGIVTVVSHTRFLPKWSAPETMLARPGDSAFNERADVWSFGVTAWECMTLGNKPFEKYSVEKLMDHVVKQRKRLPKPHDCPKSYFSLMCKCWKHEALDRPKFSEIVDMVDHVLTPGPANMATERHADDLVSANHASAWPSSTSHS